jgi:hypothetical protein
MKALEFTRAFPKVNGGGGGNRTRVREPSDRTSTYIACDLISFSSTPAGGILEELAHESSSLIL